jgi:predicted  nucleic acid-binding Zn-ribbon protein
MRKDLRRLRERLAAAEANSASDAAKCVRLQADLRQLETRMDEEVQHYGEVAKRSEVCMKHDVTHTNGFSFHSCRITILSDGI